MLTIRSITTHINKGSIRPTKHWPVNKQHSRCNSMLAWKVRDSFNDPQNPINFDQVLNLCTTKIPTISSPSEVLIKVHATSVNPLDCRMVYGYGRRVLDLMDFALNNEPKVTNDRYPLILGRDFSGEVVASGPHSKCQPGDLVFGAIEPYRSGSHGQYVVANDCCLSEKPENLSHQAAASIPFTALTCYSALNTFGHLSKNNCSGKQVLIVGGSGGVGTFAIQLLKHWGANVIATCSEKNLDYLETNLFVDKAYDHNDPDVLLSLTGQIDIILDCGAYDDATSVHQDRVDFWLKLLKPYKQSLYVTLSPPFLSQVDKYGLVLGSTKSILDAARDTFRGLTNLNSARWAFFLPNKSALNYIANLYRDDIIQPQVNSTFNLKEMASAFETLQNRQAKGKIVVDMTNLGDRVN